MRDGEDQVLHVALKRMRKICRIIKCCFMVATIMSALIWVIVVATLLVGWLKSGQEMAGAVLYSVAYGAFVVLVLWNLTRLFNEVDKGEPPFSEAQADRLQSIAIIALAIAIIALAIVILDFLISVGFIFEPAPEIGFGMVANDGIAEPTINLNIGMLVFSAIMYSLSAIFRYAALLQQLSDETV